MCLASAYIFAGSCACTAFLPADGLMRTPFLMSFQVVNIQQYAVKPRTADINENILSEQCLAETSLTEAAVKSAEPLETVLAKVSGALESSGRRLVRPSPAYLHLPC
jgi:hypothetical protein